MPRAVGTSPRRRKSYAEKALGIGDEAGTAHAYGVVEQHTRECSCDPDFSRWDSC